MDHSRIIRGAVGGGRYTVTAPITQWDYGYIFLPEIDDLPATYRLDFANDEHHGTALSVYCGAEGGEVPEELIDTGKDIFVWFFYIGDGFGKTEYKWRIPNKCKPKGGGETPEPSQQSSIDQLISVANEAIDTAQESASDASVSAQSASESATQAGQARDTAQGYVSTVQGYAESASRSEGQASNSATQAQNALSMIPSAIVETVSGGIVRFNDGADDVPMEFVEINTSATTATVVRTSRNIFAGWADGTREDDEITFTYLDRNRVKITGTSTANNADGANKVIMGASPVPIVFERGKTYKISLHGTVGINNIRFFLKDNNNSVLWYGDSTTGVWTVTPETTFIAERTMFRIPSSETTMDLDARLMIEVSDTASEYEAFDGDVYSVTLVSGVVQEEIPTLKGANTIWSIDGGITAKYHADVTLYMDGKAEQAEQSAQKAEEALTEFTSPTASATTLQAGSNATASYSNGHFDFGIPRGADGRDGTDGTDGEDGISPTVTITPITGGHRITITDKDGSHSADVMDGTGNVDDVQINGTSIVSDGVANVPIATTTTNGAMSAQDKSRLDSVYADYSSALTALGVI